MYAACSALSGNAATVAFGVYRLCKIPERAEIRPLMDCGASLQRKIRPNLQSFKSLKFNLSFSNLFSFEAIRRPRLST